METELWPHLYAACARAGVPLVIVNGRLSLRTLRAPLWLRRLYRDCLQQVSAILAISENDRTGFIALGAAAERVEVCGNIKFAAPPGSNPEAIALPRPYVLAASTREHEEKALLEAWRAAQTDGRLLVVVPRHPKRRAQILRDLAPFGLKVAVRSRGDAIGEQTAIYLADTFGELGGFMAGAELVFMGGSLVPKGGQNLLEAARLGKAVLFGQHMENFADEARQLLGAEAALQVDSPAALGGQLTRLLADPARREVLGQRAAALMAERADMAERYLGAIARYCPGG
jgi:3-deoxy-D-manno-octulosonic-acid transferase